MISASNGVPPARRGLQHIKQRAGVHSQGSCRLMLRSGWGLGRRRFDACCCRRHDHRRPLPPLLLLPRRPCRRSMRGSASTAAPPSSCAPCACSLRWTTAAARHCWGARASWRWSALAWRRRMPTATTRAPCASTWSFLPWPPPPLSRVRGAGEGEGGGTGGTGRRPPPRQPRWRAPSWPPARCCGRSLRAAPAPAAARCRAARGGRH